MNEWRAANGWDADGIANLARSGEGSQVLDRSLPRMVCNARNTCALTAPSLISITSAISRVVKSCTKRSRSAVCCCDETNRLALHTASIRSLIKKSASGELWIRGGATNTDPSCNCIGLPFRCRRAWFFTTLTAIRDSHVCTLASPR